MVDLYISITRKKYIKVATGFIGAEYHVRLMLEEVYIRCYALYNGKVSISYHNKFMVFLPSILTTGTEVDQGEWPDAYT